MRRTLRSPWHLLWTMPVAAVPAWLIAVASGVVACGISGCSGGGFGPATGLQPVAAAMVLASGAVLAAPVVLVRWTGRRGVRLAVAAIVGLGWAVLAWHLVTDRL